MTKSVSARVRSRAATMALLIAAGGLIPGLLPSCKSTLTTFNPCGTIFAFCEPYEVDLLFAEGVPDFNLDPSCTIPYYGLDPDNDDIGDCAETQIINTPGPVPR